MNVDADGDEIMSGEGRNEVVSGEDAGLVLSEETLKQVELRKGEVQISSIPSTPALVIHCSVYVPRNTPKDSVWESRRSGGSSAYQFPDSPGEIFS